MEVPVWSGSHGSSPLNPSFGPAFALLKVLTRIASACGSDRRQGSSITSLGTGPAGREMSEENGVLRRFLRSAHEARRAERLPLNVGKAERKA